jgi:hypothetical protein
MKKILPASDRAQLHLSGIREGSGGAYQESFEIKAVNPDFPVDRMQH